MKRTYFPGITDVVVVTDPAEIRSGPVCPASSHETSQKSLTCLTRISKDDHGKRNERDFRPRRVRLCRIGLYSPRSPNRCFVSHISMFQ